MNKVIYKNFFLLIFCFTTSLYCKAQLSDINLNDSLAIINDDSLSLDSTFLIQTRPSVRNKEITFYSILVDKSKTEYNDVDFSNAFDEYVTLRTDTPELRLIRREFSDARNYLEKSLKVNARKKKKR